MFEILFRDTNENLTMGIFDYIWIYENVIFAHRPNDNNNIKLITCDSKQHAEKIFYKIEEQNSLNLGRINLIDINN